MCNNGVGETVISTMFVNFKNFLNFKSLAELRFFKNVKFHHHYKALNRSNPRAPRQRRRSTFVHVCSRLLLPVRLPASPNYRMQIGRENQSCGKGIFRSVFDPAADRNRENCIETRFPGRSPFRTGPVNRQKDRCTRFYALLFTLRVSEPLAVGCTTISLLALAPAGVVTEMRRAVLGGDSAIQK